MTDVVTDHTSVLVLIGVHFTWYQFPDVYFCVWLPLMTIV